MVFFYFLLFVFFYLMHSPQQRHKHVNGHFTEEKAERKSKHFIRLSTSQYLTYFRLARLLRRPSGNHHVHWSTQPLWWVNIVRQKVTEVLVIETRRFTHSLPWFVPKAAQELRKGHLVRVSKLRKCRPTRIKCRLLICLRDCANVYIERENTSLLEKEVTSRNILPVQSRNFTYPRQSPQTFW